MTMKGAPNQVHYETDVFAGNVVYPRSAPKPIAVVPLTPDLVYEYPSSIYTIETNANEDFALSLQLNQLNADGSETPIDFGASPVLEFYVRPRFDNAALVAKLTVGSGIGMDDAATGKITLFMSQANVRASLLVSKAPANHWDHFLIWKPVGGTIELFRGSFVVHAGNYP